MMTAAIQADAARAADEPRAGRWVVLVHGIHDSARSMRWVGRRLEQRGWTVRAVSLRPNDGSVTFEAMAGQLSRFVEAEVPAGEKCDVVGFSMGGLVARCYLQELGGGARVRRLVTLSTPNHGTAWAWLSGRAGVRQMRLGSNWLERLNADPRALERYDYTSIYTPLDLTIIPANSSRMPCAHNVIVWAPVHFLMVRLPTPLKAIEHALERAQG